MLGFPKVEKSSRQKRFKVDKRNKKYVNRAK